MSVTECKHGNDVVNEICGYCWNEAQQEIDALRARVAELEGALGHLVGQCDADRHGAPSRGVLADARAALSGSATEPEPSKWDEAIEAAADAVRRRFSCSKHSFEECPSLAVEDLREVATAIRSLKRSKGGADK